MKNKFLKGLAASFALAVSGFANAGIIQVGVIGGGSSSGSDVVNQLNDDTFFDFNASLLTSSDADSLIELTTFDVLVLGESGSRDTGYTSAMYSAIRGFLENGGGVVTTGWFNYLTDPLSGQAALDADFISPFLDSRYQFARNGATVSINNGSHDITAGISDFQFSANHHELASGVDIDAYSLATVDGLTAIAAQELVGRSVYLGGLYMASSNYNTTGLRSGIEDQLLEQAVYWASSNTQGNVQTVPEPSTLAVFTLGLLGLASRKFKK